MTITPRNPFKGHHYSGEVILLAVRWYLRYPCGQNIRVRERVYDGCSSCQRTKWLGCWPTSPAWSIRNSCSRMNTWQPRIASSEPNFPPVCVFRIPNDQPLLRSVSDSAVLRFSRSPVWPSPIPSSLGTGGSLHANSTAPSCVLHPAGPASHSTSKRSLSASPGRTPVGDTTVLSEPWPISATRCPIRRWATSFDDTESSRHPSAARIPPGRISSPPTWPSWLVPTSSQSKCSPGEVSPPTTSCSSFISNLAASVSPV